jgi:mycothiol system anti-sigma-R factor
MTSQVPQVDCTETVTWLYQFVDGELTEELRIAIENHLNFCPPCGSVVSFEYELRRVIADRCRDHVPDQLRERIQAALAELAEQPSE